MIQKTKNNNNFQFYILSLILTFLFFSFNEDAYAETLSKGVETVKILKDSDIKSGLKKALDYPTKDKSKHDEDNDDNSDNNDTKEEDIVEIIVEDKEPLKLPDTFKDALKKINASGLTVGVVEDGKVKIRLLSINGEYINPCISNSMAKSGKSSYYDSSRPCKFEAGLGETHMIMANRTLQSNDCDTCQGEGVTRGCKISVNKWSCNKRPRTKCDTGSVCGD